MSLYGSEKALYIFRDTLQALRARYAEDVLTYMGNGQAEIIPVPEVCGVSDVEPVIRPDASLSRHAARIEALES